MTVGADTIRPMQGIDAAYGLDGTLRAADSRPYGVCFHTREPHITCAANITPAGRNTFRAAELIDAKGTCFRKCLLPALIAGLDAAARH